MKTNIPRVVVPESTHGGARSVRITDEFQLRRSVLSCMLWEDEFYESGETIAARIAALIPKVDAARVEALAVEARSVQHLRHIPLFIERELARSGKMTGAGLAAVIQRADELGEFLSLYWKGKKQPLSRQVKNGLAAAFRKFDEYQLAKWNRDAKIKLTDVLRLVHPRPADSAQAELWGKLRRDELAVPKTWEVELSAASGKTKAEKWLTMIESGKLGGLGTLRNLRNMIEAKVPRPEIRRAIAGARYDRVLPFRFITAAKYAPDYEPDLEAAMFKALAGRPQLPGRTVLVVDVSGSMTSAGNVSAKSELTRFDAACALAVLVREACEDPVIYATAGNDRTEIHKTAKVPPRRGFALRDAIRVDAYKQLGGGGIFLVQCLAHVKQEVESADRVIVITDEQDCDHKLRPDQADAFGRLNYLINIASAKNGIGYGPKWLHIDGWSEAVLDFIGEVEKLTLQS